MSHASTSADGFARVVEDVRRFVRRRVDDPSTRDDLVQEVLLRVHDRREQLRDDERITGWVRRIAAHVVADHYRGRRPAEALPEQIAASPAEQELDDRAMLAAWVAATVERLEAPYREVLVRTELQGLTQRAAAEQLGLTLSAVKARVRRGRAQLLERLERCCHVELDHRGALVGYEPRTPCSGPQCCPSGDG